MPPLVTLSQLKAYLGTTGTQDDARIASAASNASIMAERDTGRVFAVSSNVTRRYSTGGQSSLVIRDRPYDDPLRTITLNGVTLTEGTDVWFLTDRNNGDVSITVQLRQYDYSHTDWYKADPLWWDRNLDRGNYGYYGNYGSAQSPNDVLEITGVEGHPSLPLDVYQGVLELAAFLYWNEKSGASGFVQNPQGDQVELGEYPEAYRRLVRNWKVRTSVAGV